MALLKRVLLSGLALLICLPMLPVRAARGTAFDQSLIGTVQTTDTLTVRADWTESAASVGELSPGDLALIVGRNAENTWFRVHAYFGYGYAPAAAFSLRGDPGNLPVVEGSLPVEVLPQALAPDDPEKYPILPPISASTREIFKRGLTLGNRPDVFVKVGDCLTSDLNLFLGKFGQKDYRLGQYTDLQGVIDFYAHSSPHADGHNSFNTQSYATHSGFNISSVLDPLWLDTKRCPGADNPLDCEYRSKPGLAIILFGTNDVKFLTPVQFDYFLRLLVFETIDRGIIPLLSTFPGDPYRPTQSNLINQIIIQVAHDYDVPVINLWLALQPLPGHGRNPNSPDLSWTAQTRASYFDARDLAFGHTLRNLVTLQMLDRVWREVLTQG